MVRFIVAIPILFVLLLGYAVAAALWLWPVYVVVVLFAESITIVPDTSHEFKLIGILVGAGAVCMFLRVVHEALGRESEA